MFGLKRWRWLVLLAMLAPLNGAGAQSPSTHRLSIDDLIDIKHPSSPVWSPDGRRVAFLWDRADIVNLYVANSDGQGQPLALTAYPDGKVGDVFWSHDGGTVYFSRNGDLWQIGISGGEPRAVWATPSPEVEISTEWLSSVQPALAKRNTAVI